MTDHQQRLEMIRQMLATYDREPTEDRIKGYLTVIQPIPVGSLPAALRNAMGNSGGFPPGPGEILMAWHWQTAHKAEPIQASDAPRLGPGAAREQIQATVGGYRLSVSMQEVAKRAKEIRAEGRYVPKEWSPGNLLAHIKASIELGMDWPLSQATRDRLSRGVRQHEAEGGDCAWWHQETRQPTVTR